MLKPDELLATLRLSDKSPLVKPLVYCYISDKCKDVLNLIMQHHLTCLPVFGARRPAGNCLGFGDGQGKLEEALLKHMSCCFHRAPPNAEVVGMIDAIDLVKLIAKLHGDTRGFPQPTRYAIEWVEWNAASVKEALAQRKRTPFVLPLKATMLDAARVLIDGRVPRVLVRDDKQRIVNIITQSDLVNALDWHLSEIEPEVLNRPISAFRHIEKFKDPSRILKVDQRARAIEAFRMMDYGDVSAVPVVDNEQRGKLVSNISARDIRAIIAEEEDFPMSLYTNTALQFSQRMHQRKDTHAPMAVSLQMSHTFKDVLQTLHEYKIHRVWITNEQQQVISVLALCDVLAEVVEP